MRNHYYNKLLYNTYLTMVGITPIFFVNTHIEPILIKVCGRATYLNSFSLNDFFQWMLSNSTTRCIIDFSECVGIDSTFLGILAGFALELKKLNKQSDCKLSNLSDRNLELVENMGLNYILTVSTESLDTNKDWTPFSELEKQRPTKEMILKAHENLVAINSSNCNKFEDVIAFLKKQSSK